MIRFCILALVSSAAMAQTAPASKPPPVQLVEQPKRIPLSDEGRAIAAKAYGTPDPRTAQIASDLAALRAERSAMATTGPVDLDRLDALLRKEEALMAEAHTRNNDRLMALLHALPEGDRLPMLQNMANAARLGAKPVVAR